MRVQPLNLGRESTKPAGEGLWLRTKVSGRGRGEAWALAAAELLETAPKW